MVDTGKYLANPLKSDPLPNGIATGNWGFAADVFGSAAAGALKGGVWGAVAAGGAALVMHTPLGQWATGATATAVFDNGLGMRPGTAYIWSSIVLRIAATYGIRSMLPSATAGGSVKGKSSGQEQEEIDWDKINSEQDGITWDDVCQAQYKRTSSGPALLDVGGTGGGSGGGMGGSFPPNRGFLDSSSPATLRPGAIVDRYGDAGGSFLSPRGTSFAARSLPAEAAARPLTAYKVVAPVQVQAGTTAPAYGQSGGGIQYDLGGRSVRDLIKQGYIIEQ